MNIYVKKSQIHGRGLFASKDFEKGEMIIEAQVVVLPKKDKDLIDTVMTSILSNYLITWGKNNDLSALVLSDFSFCNHSLDPNADYTTNIYKKTVTVKALNHINKDEEILINYNGDPENKTPWKF